MRLFFACACVSVCVCVSWASSLSVCGSVCACGCVCVCVCSSLLTMAWKSLGATLSVGVFALVFVVVSCAVIFIICGERITRRENERKQSESCSIK